MCVIEIIEEDKLKQISFKLFWMWVCVKQWKGYKQRYTGYTNKTDVFSQAKGDEQLLNKKKTLFFSYWIYKGGLLKTWKGFMRNDK